MREILDLDLYPLDNPDAPQWRALVAQCQADLVRDGLFNLPAFLHPEATAKAVAEVTPILETAAFTHAREHNIYFRDRVEGLAADHPALRRFKTANRTICADQLPATAVLARLYDWPPFAQFLAAVMDKPVLYPMADPLARFNVMAYGAAQALNWHFDRSEFTTTLLLQAPEGGGAFEYARDLRSADDPNYDGVAALIEGRLATTVLPLEAGTLNVFQGVNTAHRVTPVSGETDRIIAVFSYFDRPGVEFSAAERMGFYGRVG